MTPPKIDSPRYFCRELSRHLTSRILELDRMIESEPAGDLRSIHMAERAGLTLTRGWLTGYIEGLREFRYLTDEDVVEIREPASTGR